MRRKMNTQVAKNKSKAQIAREQVLAQLDELDKEIPDNPGQSEDLKATESFTENYESKLKKRN